MSDFANFLSSYRVRFLIFCTYNFYNKFIFTGIWRFWAPPLERSRLATIAFSGSYAGVVIGMPLSGILASYISWEAAFFFYGVMGMVWYCFWLWLSFEKPRCHPAISMKELKYIEKSLGSSVNLEMPKISTTPWHEIARSMPVIAIIVANFCRSWNFYLLVLYQSKYLKHVYNMDLANVCINKVSVLFCFLCKSLFIIIGGSFGSTSTFVNDNYRPFWWNVG